MLHRWSHSAESVRVSAFLVIRMSAIVSPYPFIDIALKGIYLTFIRNCKFPSPVVRPTLTFMLNAVVELYRLDEVAAYQHAFVYIRQLAIHREWQSS
jgi:nucleolar complex protein 2